jgi:hypothetical protein
MHRTQGGFRASASGKEDPRGGSLGKIEETAKLELFLTIGLCREHRYSHYYRRVRPFIERRILRDIRHGTRSCIAFNGTTMLALANFRQSESRLPAQRR